MTDVASQRHTDSGTEVETAIKKDTVIEIQDEIQIERHREPKTGSDRQRSKGKQRETEKLVYWRNARIRRERRQKQTGKRDR